MKFSSLYNNYLTQSINTYDNIIKNNNSTNMNKIKVNKNNNSKVFSPISNVKNITNKNNKFIITKNKNTKNSNLIQSPNYYKDINYIKYININVDIDKIKYIQIWWKYIYKMIIIQKNFRRFIVAKKIKKKLRYYNFIISIIKIYFHFFIDNIQICYIRYYFKKWKEIVNKRIILNKLLIENGKKNFSVSNSFNNNSMATENNNHHNNKSMIMGNVKRIVFNNSTILQEKIFSPFRKDAQPERRLNVRKNIKKNKNIACNIYNSKEKNNSLNKSLTNKDKFNKYCLNDSKINSSNSNVKRAKSITRRSNLDNKSFNFDEKTEALTNNIHKNIKEYYNINDININPTISTINFYPSNLNKKNTKKIKTTQDYFKNNKNTTIINNAKLKKRTLIISKKINNNNKNNLNEFNRNNNVNTNSSNMNANKKVENYISYQNTFGNLKTTLNNNFNKNNNNKNIQTTAMSPASNRNRIPKRNKNRSLEFQESDINSIKILLKFKRTFLHWKNLMFKKRIIRKLRLIQKIKNIIYVYKILYIKLFFYKMIQSIYKNSFYQNKINFNNIVLNQYYNKLKEISKKKKLINDINSKYQKRIKISKKEKEKSNKNIFYNKNNSNLNYNTETSTAGLYYATQFNQKFNRLLNDKKSGKNSNIIIINNNINNNCQQLINNNIKQNKENNININNNYYKKNGNNNSMIDIQPNDTLLNCTMDLNIPSDKSLNNLLVNNQHIIARQRKLINKKNISHTNKIYYLNKLVKIIYKINNKKILNTYFNEWKIKTYMKKCYMSKNNIIDEKIIHFPKSPNSSNNNTISNNFIENHSNYMYNYGNNCNFTFDNNNNTNINNYVNMNNNLNNNDLIIHTLFTENSLKNPKKLYGNNASNTTLLRNKMFSPSNKFSFYTQYQNEKNNLNYLNPLRDTEPKIVYHKKLFPSFGSKNFKQNNNTIIIDYNYNNNNKENNLSFSNNINMNMNNFHYDFDYNNNIINNFYSNNNFYNRRNNYHLENWGDIPPEEKYGIKKMNKIEEREISFSPSLSRKNHSIKNVIKDNYQNINNNNIYINVVENFRNDYQSQNQNMNEMKRYNYTKYQPINRSLTEEDNFNKIMCHSHSQGFTKTIQSLFGH